MTQPIKFNRKCSNCGVISRYSGLIRFCPECGATYKSFIIRDSKHCTTKYCKGRPIFNSNGVMIGYTQ